jgi:hypothetical protein
MRDRPYLERLRELTGELSLEQNPGKRNAILERMLFMIQAQATAHAPGDETPDSDLLRATMPEPDAETEPGD